MLVVVDIGAVLEKPLLLLEGNGYEPQILPCGMPQPPGVALVLPAQQALRIAPLGRCFRRGDGLRVLLRLGEIDGDIQLPVGGGGLPLHIPCDAVAPDVVRVLTEAVKPVRRLRRSLAVALPERADDLRGSGCQPSHQLRVEQVAADSPVLNAPLCRRLIQQLL